MATQEELLFNALARIQGQNVPGPINTGNLARQQAVGSALRTVGQALNPVPNILQGGQAFEQTPVPFGLGTGVTPENPVGQLGFGESVLRTPQAVKNSIAGLLGFDKPMLGTELTNLFGALNISPDLEPNRPDVQIDPNRKRAKRGGSDLPFKLPSLPASYEVPQVNRPDFSAALKTLKGAEPQKPDEISKGEQIARYFSGAAGGALAALKNQGGRAGTFAEVLAGAAAGGGQELQGIRQEQRSAHERFLDQQRQHARELATIQISAETLGAETDRFNAQMLVNQRAREWTAKYQMGLASAIPTVTPVPGGIVVSGFGPDRNFNVVLKEDEWFRDLKNLELMKKAGVTDINLLWHDRAQLMEHFPVPLLPYAHAAQALMVDGGGNNPAVQAAIANIKARDPESLESLAFSGVEALQLGDIEKVTEKQGGAIFFELIGMLTKSAQAAITGQDTGVDPSLWLHAQAIAGQNPTMNPLGGLR